MNKVLEAALYPFYVIPMIVILAIKSSLTGEKAQEEMKSLLNPFDGSLGL